jgi:hypothetical protein
MKRTRHTAEQIIRKLKTAVHLIAHLCLGELERWELARVSPV